MTKQEQIEEMSNIIAEVAFVQAHEENGDECLSDIVAEALYNAGYRKADEVRKETAKEILDDLYFNLGKSAQGIEPKSNDYYNVFGWIEEIAKERGVEIEQ